MAEIRLINNLQGILYYLDTPLLDFEVKDRNLIKAVDLNGGNLYPMELAVWGISYGNLNAFFERRTMKEGCMFYREHLKAIGMERFDFDTYIRKNNGNNNLDNYWVKFPDFGAKCFRDIAEHNSCIWQLDGSESGEYH
ncbi:MAG: hypothetical protein J6N53_13655 [Lachnospiraceae bacterium]|nr:hypothetical protein [Lachnospiraceae bacterium]MBO6299878.1 hypothetical protein [Lachnospiraceae bacterium]MBP3296414.1 hypothetical protein [Lachnospiraceae bacterium]MCR5126540.1 hypothetical protein [Lachnospiraceae bacterium]